LVLTKEDLYHRLKLTDIPGIGHRQEKNLNALGIKTLLDLKNYPLSHLVSRFGRISGYHLHQMGQLNATWKPKVDPSQLAKAEGRAMAGQEEEIKSIGHMYTLPQEYRDQKFFMPVLYKLCEMVAKRLRKQGLMGNVVYFYVHDKNYQGFGQNRKLGFYVYDGREIFLQAVDIFNKIRPSSFEFKLIGITVAGLTPVIDQLSLFGHEERLKRLTKALDNINLKYGDFTVCRVPILSAKNAFHDSIGFGRLREKFSLPKE
jgi:DNA polymerase-4